MPQGFTERDVADQSGRTFLVTGANTGIGFETAKVLAERGGRVLLGCRSEQRAGDAMAKIRAESPAADVEFLPLDQADLGSVCAAAERASAEPRLDVLINNAGIMGVPRSLTVDGFESQFAVNHLGTFALTGLLLPKLEETEGSRVVITASLAHRGGRIHWEDIDGAKVYSRQARYQQSKLANLLHMYELDRRLKARGCRTIAVACHPGLAQTEIGRAFPMIRMAAPLVRTFFNTQAMGAWPTLMAATAPGLTGSDCYGPRNWGELSGPAVKAWSSPASRDPELRRRLWELSVETDGGGPGDLTPVKPNPIETQVLIVGGGPIGLMSSLLLSRLGVKSLVVDLRGRSSTHPRSRLLDAPSVELMREIGAEQEVIASGLGPDWTQYNRWFDSLAGTEICRVPTPSFHSVQTDRSSSMPVMTAQDYVEAILYDKAASDPNVDLRFDTAASALSQDGAGVTSTIRDNRSGRADLVSAEFAVGADGLRSSTRAAIGTELEADYMDVFFQDVIFDADFSKHTRDRQGGLLFIAHSMGAAVFQPLDGVRRWRCQIGGFDRTHEMTAEFAESWIRSAPRRGRPGPDRSADDDGVAVPTGPRRPPGAQPVAGRQPDPFRPRLERPALHRRTRRARGPRAVASLSRRDRGARVSHSGRTVCPRSRPPRPTTTRKLSRCARTASSPTIGTRLVCTPARRRSV